MSTLKQNLYNALVSRLQGEGLPALVSSAKAAAKKPAKKTTTKKKKTDD